MAENKKSFVLYCDLIHTIKKMPDDKAGLLFKHLLSYVNDENPVTNDLLIELTFEPIKQQLKRDLGKWENEIIKKADSGALGNLKRWNEDLYNKVINNDLSLQKAIEIAKHRKASQSDNINRKASQSIANIAVNDNVNVNVSVNDINISFDVFWNLYNKKVGDKKKVESKWNKLKDSERQKIIDTLPIFLNSIKDKQFQPHPQTYLNNSRWNDEISESLKSDKKHYYLCSPFGRWDGLLTEDEFKAKTFSGHWTLEKIV
jgi:hypothetical protein